MSSKTQTLVSILKKTLAGKCPQCGIGKLYVSFLKTVTCCERCNADFSNIRADDAPAWLTILIVGHILAPILLFLPMVFDYPDWLLILVIIIPSLLLSLIILPFSKSLFIGILWNQKHNKRKTTE